MNPEVPRSEASDWIEGKKKHWQASSASLQVSVCASWLPNEGRRPLNKKMQMRKITHLHVIDVDIIPSSEIVHFCIKYLKF